MKFLKFSSFLALYCLSLSAYSEYQVKLPLTDKYGLSINQSWIPESPIVSNWLNYNNPYDCTSWTPDASTIDEDVSFTQTQANCKQDQKRTVTSRETNKVTGETRTIDTVTETQTISVGRGNFTQHAIGTRSPIGCYYNTTNNVVYGWDGSKGMSYHIFVFKNVTMGRTEYSTAVTVGKYTYYQGAFKANSNFSSSNEKFYEICVRLAQ